MIEDLLYDSLWQTDDITSEVFIIGWSIHFYLVFYYILFNYSFPFRSKCEMNTFIYFEIIKFIYVFVFLAIIRLVIWEQFYININFKMSWTFLYFWIMPHFRLVIVEISIQIEFNKWKVYLQIIYIILYYIYIFFITLSFLFNAYKILSIYTLETT